MPSKNSWQVRQLLYSLNYNINKHVSKTVTHNFELYALENMWFDLTKLLNEAIQLGVTGIEGIDFVQTLQEFHYFMYI